MGDTRKEKKKKRKKKHEQFYEWQATVSFVMSRLPNGNNGYTNGHYSQEPSNRYEEDHHNGGPVERGRERRAGGYEGSVNDRQPAQEVSEGQNSSFLGSPESNTYNNYMRSISKRRDLDYDNSSKSRERNAPGLDSSRSYRNGPGSRQIEGQWPKDFDHIEKFLLPVTSL